VTLARAISEVALEHLVAWIVVESSTQFLPHHDYCLIIISLDLILNSYMYQTLLANNLKKIATKLVVSKIKMRQTDFSDTF